MGHKRRRRRKSACEEAAAIIPAASPQTVTGPARNGWFTRFAVAFLIIFLLLWLLAPRDHDAGRT